MVAVAAALGLLPACSGDKTDKPEVTAGDAGADSADAGADPDVSPDAPDIAQVIEDTLDTASSDAVTDTVEDQGDAVVPEVAPDVPPADIAECTTSTDCSAKLALSPCQDPLCDLGTCKAISKPYPSCCSNAACDDKDECTTDSCDLASHACKNAVDPQCCSGKKSLLKATFESEALDGLKATDAPGNGNVGWQVTKARAHSGGSSLYFGNACKTYDTSMTADTGCKTGKDAVAVSTSLTTGDSFLPEGKKAHLVFWLWLDTEPPYANQFKAGVCKPGCPQGASCLIVNGVAQCLAEKDVLTLVVLDAGKPWQVFSSAQIGKTTGGQWQQVAIDLSGWAGKNIKLQWHFATGSGIKNDYEGVYLDDIVWETVCAQVNCDSQNACKDDTNACTADTCSPYSNGAAGTGSGACLYGKYAGCCNADSDCDDSNSCTVDGCKNGQCQNNPDAAKPACCKSAVLLYSPFDEGLTDWTVLQQNSTSVQWRFSPNGGESGGALQFSNEEGESYADVALNEDIGPKGLVCSKIMALKQGSVFNLLTFKLKLATEWSAGGAKGYVNPPVAGLPKYDLFTVQVVNDKVPTTVWTSDLIYGSTGGKWQAITVPLDAYQGKNVQVCLGFDAGDGSKNDFSGPLVDELAVKVACSKQLCYVDGECASKKCSGGCETAQCDAQNGCVCGKIAGCCAGDGDCDDKDDCTSDLCTAGKCKNDKIVGCPAPPP